MEMIVMKAPSVLRSGFFIALWGAKKKTPKNEGLPGF
jgi:hypothetical protein